MAQKFWPSVGPLGRAEAEVVEDLLAPSAQGAAEGADLGHRIRAAAEDRLVQQDRRDVGVGAQLHVSHRFLSVN
ncbi:MAG: hypothetical protein ACRDQ2_16425 [Gaiellales bacterium]